MALINGKIRLSKELTFDFVEDFLLEQGYSWIRPGKIRQSDLTDVNVLFFYKNGSLRFSNAEPEDKFWLKHPNPTYTIVDNELVILNE